MSNLVCGECNGTTFTRHGMNHKRTAYRYTCKTCGTNMYVPIEATTVEVETPVSRVAVAPAVAANSVSEGADVVINNPATIKIILNGQEKETNMTPEDLRAFAEEAGFTINTNTQGGYTLLPKPATKG